MAKETLKDSYIFDLLGVGEEAQERDIESALTRHITRFLLELGVGFAFVGRQFRLEVGGEEFFIDLLFYHTRMKCYVVVELKATAFKPEHAGKLNFYLSVMDGQVKAPDDRPTMGCCFAGTRSAWSPSMPFRAWKNPWVSRNTNCCGPFRNPWIPPCRPSRRLKRP